MCVFLFVHIKYKVNVCTCQYKLFGFNSGMVNMRLVIDKASFDVIILFK